MPTKYDYKFSKIIISTLKQCVFSTRYTILFSGRVRFIIAVSELYTPDAVYLRKGKWMFKNNTTPKKWRLTPEKYGT